jgi:hypothetical protein
VFAAVVVAAALVLPEILDTPAVRSELQRKLSEAVQGEVDWEDLNIRVLPSPRGIVRRARIEIRGSLEVNAEQLAVRLAFWPLLRGRVEIVSVDLSRPVIRLDIAAAPDDRDKARVKKDDTGPDLATTWRSTAGGIAGIVRRFAPDTVLSVEDARLEFSAPGILPIALHDVAVRARTDRSGMDLDASLAGTHWSRVKLSARVQFADLSGQADIEIAGLKPQPWLDHYLAKSPLRVALPAGDLRFQARIDGKTELDGDFELRAAFLEVLRGAQRVRIPELQVKGRIEARGEGIRVRLDDVGLGAGRLAGGMLHYSVRSGAATLQARFDLDTAQTMENARRLAPEAAAQILARFQPEGRAQGSVKVALGRPDWSVVVDIVKSDVAVRGRDLPGPVRLAHGIVEIDRHGVKVNRAAASMPAGQVRLSTLHHSYGNQATVASAEFDIDLAQGLELARRVLPQDNGDALAVIQSASGRAHGTTKLAFGRKSWSVEADIQKADAQVQVKGLPGPTGLSSGSVHVTPGTVKVERAAVTLLDARATASTIIDFRAELRVQGSIAEGTVGGKFLEWVWQTADAPPHLALKTPIGITAPRFAWGPKGALDVNATARFATGQSVGVDLGWASDGLHIRRATIKDQRSNATIGARIAGSRVEGQFSGSLHGSSIASMLKSVLLHEGGVSGKLRFAFDRERPRDASAEGNLKGESLDISWLAGRPIKIERIDLATDGTSLRIGEATVNWAGQRATIRGDVKQGAAGPVIDAQVDSAGIDVDVLLQAGDRKVVEKPPAAESRPDLPAGKRELSRLWPLPVTGQFSLRSNFLQRGRYRIAPIVATLALQPERAHLELQQAQLCGISLPMTIDATPGGVIASAKFTAQKQQLEETARCLADQHVLITGEFDLKADLTSRGKIGDLARSMKGSVVADIRDGKVMKFALLGNILSMGNVASLMKADGPKLDAQGFPYRKVVMAGRFDGGRFILDEGAFQSDALGLAANGWISTTDYSSRLTVLVAPFGRIDRLVRDVPILGYIVGGTFTSVPVGVSGDIRDPLVVPLGPAAVTSEVLGIFERTLKLPVKLISPAEK